MTELCSNSTRLGLTSAAVAMMGKLVDGDHEPMNKWSGGRRKLRRGTGWLLASEARCFGWQRRRSNVPGR